MFGKENAVPDSVCGAACVMTDLASFSARGPCFLSKSAREPPLQNGITCASDAPQKSTTPSA
eukprot:3470415-Pleurochrysis_carterae.AAC.2